MDKNKEAYVNYLFSSRPPRVPKIDCKEVQPIILSFLQKEKEIATCELDEIFLQYVSKATLGRAKTALKKKGAIGFRNEGYGNSKRFFTYVKETR